MSTSSLSSTQEADRKNTTVYLNLKLKLECQPLLVSSSPDSAVSRVFARSSCLSISIVSPDLHVRSSQWLVCLWLHSPALLTQRSTPAPSALAAHIARQHSALHRLRIGSLERTRTRNPNNPAPLCMAVHAVCATAARICPLKTPTHGTTLSTPNRIDTRAMMPSRAL